MTNRYVLDFQKIHQTSPRRGRQGRAPVRHSRTGEMSCAASSESPPSAWKSSSAPTGPTPSISSHTRATAQSPSPPAVRRTAWRGAGAGAGRRPGERRAPRGPACAWGRRRPARPSSADAERGMRGAELGAAPRPCATRPNPPQPRRTTASRPRAEVRGERRSWDASGGKGGAGRKQVRGSRDGGGSENGNGGAKRIGFDPPPAIQLRKFKAGNNCVYYS